ncbi:MAG: TonB-dependent receptor plug domain-containing protein [Oceanobacter sp.]
MSSVQCSNHPNRGIRLFALGLFLPLAVSTVEAGTKEVESPWMEMEALVVTASRTPELLADTTMRTQVLNSGTIERMQSKDLSEALRLVPGLQLEEIHGKTGKQVVLQGFSGDRVLVLMDGMPISATTGSTVDVTQSSALDIERVEVVPGSASSLYGSAAMGGVVNIITRKDADQIRLMAEAGSYGDRELSNGIAPQRHYVGSFGRRWNGISLELFADQRQVAETDLDVSTAASNGFDGNKTNLGTTLGYQWQEGETYAGQLRFNLQRYSEDLTQQSSDTLLKDEDLKRWRTALQLSQSTRAGQWSFSALNESQQDDTFQRNRDSSILVGQLKREADYDQYKYSVQFAHDEMDVGFLPNGGWRWVLGMERAGERMNQSKYQLSLGDLVDYEEYASDPDDDASDGVVVGDTTTWTQYADGYIASYGNEVNVEDAQRHVNDAFSQHTMSWDMAGAEWALSPGLRWQSDSDFGHHWVPTLSARQSWPLGDLTLRTRQSIGAGYRVANLKERYYIFDHSIYGYKVLGNTELTPEHSRSNQISIAISDDDRWQLELAAFVNQLTDLISTEDTGEYEVSTSGNWVAIYQYENIESARTRGLTLSSQWKPHYRFEQRLSYSYLDARNLGADMPLSGKAKHNAKLVWLMNLTTDLSLNLMGEFRGGLYGEVNSDEDTARLSPDYWQWDLTMDWNPILLGQDVRLFAGVKNLNDAVRDPAHTYDKRPSTGRYLYSGVDLRF